MGQELQIGRSAAAEGRLGDDPEISRQHARITRNPQGQLVVEDLGSTNGTYVNGQRISGPTTLNPGDTVQMGRSSLSIEGGAAPAGGQATAIGAVPAAIPPAAPPPPPGGGAPPPPPPGGGFTPQGPGPGGPGGYGPKQGGGNNAKIAVIAGAVVAVIVIAVVLVLALGGGDDEGDDPTTAANTTTQQTTQTTDTATTEPTTTETFSMDTSELSTEISTETGGGDITEPGNYPPNIKDQFIEGCTGGGGTEEQCTCTIDAIEDEYSLTEFLDLISKASGGLPDELQDIVRQCA